MTSHCMQCCGWKELHGLNSWDGREETFARFLRCDNYVGENSSGAVLFTSNYKDSKGLNNAILLSRLIRKRKLGRLTKLREFINPNTNRTITTYIWFRNNNAIQKYKRSKATVKKAKGGMIYF